MGNEAGEEGQGTDGNDDEERPETSLTALDDSTRFTFYLSSNPLDYDRLLDLPLWLIYSYLSRLLEDAEAKKKALEQDGDSDAGVTTPVGLGAELEFPVQTVPAGTIQKQLAEYKEQQRKEKEQSDGGPESQPTA